MDDFNIRGDVMPDVLARRWIVELKETQWCLAKACQNAAVSKDVQQAVVQFPNCEQLLKYSRIIYLSMKLFNLGDYSDWWSRLSDLENTDGSFFI